MELAKDNLENDELLAVQYSDNEIAGFPYEGQELVIISAAIKAAEHLLAAEEDTELYLPIAANLKQDYKHKVTILKTRDFPQQQAQQRRR